MQTRKTPPDKEDVKEILSNRLYDLVGEKTESTGMKQEEQAREAGIASYAKYLDQNRKHPTTLPESYSLYCIADYYGVSCDYLLGREDAPDSGRIPLIGISCLGLLSCLSHSASQTKRRSFR